MKRKIVKIDEEKCNGCGQCVSACVEGAIELVNGKARLVSDIYCDGLGACIGECPQGAITIEEREAPRFDEEAVKQRLAGLHSKGQPDEPSPQVSGGCPGMKARAFTAPQTPPGTDHEVPASALTHWPVQLHLVPVNAPYWQDADLLIAADCTAFACGGFHPKLLRDKKVIIACPKLDDTSSYVEKLTAIFRENTIRSITVAHMEVPCCTGLINITRQALAQSGRDLPFTTVRISIQGSVEEEAGE